MNNNNGKPAGAGSESVPEENGDINEVHLDRKLHGREALLSSQISLYVADQKPKIPDGGWGWWVVFSSFTLNVISEGVCFTFGLLYIEFLEEFGASKSATSWIGSLFMAIPLLAGPLGSALVDKYGCKSMTVLGGVICAIGFFLSAYANSIGFIYVTFGIIGGIGRCLTYVTCVVSIAFWFEKRRSVALGLSASGAGIGTITFAPLSVMLINEYGWRGTVLILAGLFFNMCVCGVLMRDPDWVIEEGVQEKIAKKAIKHRGHTAAKECTAAKIEELRNILKNGLGTEDPKNNTSEAYSDQSIPKTHLPTYEKHNEKVSLDASNQPHENKEPQDLNAQHLQTLREAEEATFPKIAEEDELDRKDTPLLQDNALNQDKSRQTYLKNLKYKRNSVGHRGMSNIHKHKSTGASCPDISTVDLSEQKKQNWYGEFIDILKDLTNFSLFLELHFLLLATATINLFIWFIVPYIFLAEHMVRIGYTEDQASNALSAIGLANTIGMVGLGWAGDRLNVGITYAVSLIICGISVLLMMYFTNSYTLLLLNCGLFGVSFGSCFSLSPSLLASLVPLEKFTMAYGLGLLCEGIGNLIGPPLAGFLFDITQSWEQSFYQAGFWIIISGILILIIPLTKNRRIIGSAPLMASAV